MSNVFPLPFPRPILPPFRVDLTRVFRDCANFVSEMRVARSLLPLVPNSEISVGQEQLSQNYDAPSITIVPIGVRFESGANRGGQFDALWLQTQWVQCEAHLWGEDDPRKLDSTYSFSSSLELLRQLAVATQAVFAGQSNLKWEGARWEQKTDINRTGRMLVVTFALRYYILTDDPIQAAFATSTSPGVQAQVTANLQTADGTSTVTEAIFVAPP